MMRNTKIAVLMMAALVAGVVISAAFNLSPRSGAFWGGEGAPAPKVEPVAAVGERLAGRNIPLENIPTLFKEVSPSVVNISTTQVVRFNRPHGRNPFGQGDPFEDFFNNFFGGGGGGAMPREQKRKSLGSGFLVSEDGYILTNNHVVEKADDITVTLLDKEEFKAKLVGGDAKTDIALIKIKPGKKLPYARLGNSDGLEIGEWLAAIGNPFGLGHTITTGIVSAKGRIIGSGPYDDFIQTDASINPGNSGGPLFNLRGEVVGINTAIVQGGQGIGFATPINLAKAILGQLKEKGHVTRGWLGVYIQRLTPEMAESLGVTGTKGALVADVTKGGPAEKAGLRSGDVIVGYNGKAVNDEHEIPQMVAATRPGTQVNVKVLRDGREIDVPVTIAEMEAAPGERAGEDEGPDVTQGLGLSVQEITPQIARHFQIENRKGVLVSGVANGSAADEAGFQEGDIIRQINRQAVGSVREFNQALRKAGKDKTVLFLVERGDARLFLAVGGGK